MKWLIGKVLYFFRSGRTSRYLIEIFIFCMSLGAFLFFAATDVVGNVFGTIIGFLFSTVLLYIVKVVFNSFEDLIKINYDTEHLLKLYKGAPSYRKELHYGDTSRTFAYADRLINQGYTFEVIDDPAKAFVPDDFVMGNYPTIFSAHANSTKFNATTIRLDHFELDSEGHCKFYLSRSTVFHHLVTNRAIDYILFDNITLRDIYEYGPVLNPLSESKMSNHVGINALVFLSDGRLLVPRRKRDSTVSKNRVTSSIAVKLDFPRGKSEVDTEHLMRGTIIDNLSARLNLPHEQLGLDQVEINFLGFGQNVYEGGKPQFYYTVRLKNIDTAAYFALCAGKAGTVGLDIDRLVYVADYESFRFKKDDLRFCVIDPATGKRKKRRVSTKCEMSYLCNLWHHEQQKNARAEKENATT